MSTFKSPLKSGDKAQDALGNVVLTQSATMTFADFGTAKNLFKIAKPYRIVDLFADVDTAFNSSGTDLLDLGKTGTAEQFAADIDVSSTGRKTGIQAAKFANLVDSTDDGSVEQIIGTLAQSVADASAGSLTVTIVYVSTKTLAD